MIRHMASRILTSLGLIFATLLVSFLLMHAAPGDPASMMIDPRMSDADIQQVRENMGLTKSLPSQFLEWFGNVLSGNLGYSLSTGQPVIDVISSRLPATLLLSISTLAIVVFLSVVLGIISAIFVDQWPDKFIAVGTFIMMSIPSFWVGLMGILLFSVMLDWLPASGFSDPLIDPSDWATLTGSVLQHMILPVATGVIGSIAVMTRYYRYGLINVLGSPYIKAAKTRGLPSSKLLFVHALKNAMIPIITLLGMELPGLVSGAFVIETIFGWPGLGQLGVSAAFSRDYPVLMGTLLFSSILIILGNGIADTAYRWVDPRIRRARS